MHATLLSEISSHYHLSSTTTNPTNPQLSQNQQDKEKVIPYKQALSLPYLQAVIKEGLRWYPPVTGMMSKEVTSSSTSSSTGKGKGGKGDEWKGIHLPPGAQVGFSLWGVMRDESFWGSDADEFVPERWLLSNPPHSSSSSGGKIGGTEGGEEEEEESIRAKKIKEMEARVGLVFGYGKWQCLGKDVAMMELNKVFVEVSFFLLFFFFPLFLPFSLIFPFPFFFFSSSPLLIKGFSLLFAPIGWYLSQFFRFSLTTFESG